MKRRREDGWDGFAVLSPRWRSAEAEVTAIPLTDIMQFATVPVTSAEDHISVGYYMDKACPRF